MIDTEINDEVVTVEVAEAAVVERHPGLRSAVRRVATVVLLLSLGPFVFDRLIAPVMHDRANAMLEQRLESDLLNGIAPVSYPIEVGTPIGLIEIRDRDIRAVVVEGTEAEQLAMAVGHLRGSRLPGQPGVVAVLGRSSRFGSEFSGLDEVEVDDEVTVTSGQGIHTYRVIDAVVRASDDLAAFKGEGNMLILSTITGDSDRLVVRAVLTSSVMAPGADFDHVTSSSELGLTGHSGSSTVVWLFIGALLALGWPLLVMVVGRRVAWMAVAPLALWVVVEIWSAMALSAPGSY
jgi:sortase A